MDIKHAVAVCVRKLQSSRIGHIQNRQTVRAFEFCQMTLHHGGVADSDKAVAVNIADQAE